MVSGRKVCLVFCLLLDCFICKQFWECQISWFLTLVQKLSSGVPPPLKLKCLDVGSLLTTGLLDMQVRYKEKSFQKRIEDLTLAQLSVKLLRRNWLSEVDF